MCLVVDRRSGDGRRQKITQMANIQMTRSVAPTKHGVVGAKCPGRMIAEALLSRMPRMRKPTLKMIRASFFLAVRPLLCCLWIECLSLVFIVHTLGHAGELCCCYCCCRYCGYCWRCCANANSLMNLSGCLMLIQNVRTYIMYLQKTHSILISTSVQRQNMYYIANI